MNSRIRLEAGTYRAVDALAVYLMQGSREVSFANYGAGEEFVVPYHVNGFWAAVVYYPGLGEKAPRFEEIEAAHA